MHVSDLHASSLSKLSADQRTAILSQLSPREAETILYDWPFWARDKQLAPPGDWLVWLVLAGRGFGKTRTGVEWVRSQIELGHCRRMALIARTAADVRDVLVEGESGILAISPPWFRPRYEPSKRRLTWPNGAIATTYSADEPDLLRGPQHDGALCDELASWRYPEVWDMLMFGLRLGDKPQVVVTTTPKPVKHLKDLIKSPTTTITRGSTFENRSNLAPAFFQSIVAKYKDTRLGQQELMAAMLDDTPGALWTRAVLEMNRVTAYPPLKRVAIGVDPQASAEEGSAETGIVAAGVDDNGHGYVLDDKSIMASPDGWARQAVAAYHRFKGDRMVAEANNGGDMVISTIRTIDKNVSLRKVFASRGKYTRAEPIGALYEQGRVHHVGLFAELEDQMCSWVPGDDSPDRLDALVWALTELMLGPQQGATIGRAVGLYPSRAQQSNRRGRRR